MKRVGFCMKLYPGKSAEYKKRHDEIWPELSEALRDAGVYDYSIFLDEETDTLFAVQKLKDNDSSANLPLLPIVRKWWTYMSDIMETNPDDSPVVRDLKEMFYFE